MLKGFVLYKDIVLFLAIFSYGYLTVLPTNMARVCNEIVLHIIRFLSVPERVALRLACRDFRDLVDSSFSSQDRYREFSKLTYCGPTSDTSLKWWWTTFFHDSLKCDVFYSICMLAIDQNKADILAWMLEEAVVRLIPVVRYKETLARTAARDGSLSCLQVLVKSGLSKDSLSTVLYQAVEGNDVDCTFYLINNQAPIYSNLMQSVVKHQNLEMLKLLFGHIDEANKPDFVNQICHYQYCYNNISGFEIYKWLWDQQLISKGCQKRILQYHLSRTQCWIFTSLADHFQYLEPTDLLNMIEDIFPRQMDKSMPALYFIVNHTVSTHRDLLCEKLKEFRRKHDIFMTQEDMACIERVYEIVCH